MGRNSEVGLKNYLALNSLLYILKLLKDTSINDAHWRTISGTDISVKLEQGRANYSRVPAISKYILSLNAYVLDITPIIKYVILKTTLNWLICFLYMNIFYINFLEQQNLKFVSLSFAYPMFIWEWEKSTSLLHSRCNVKLKKKGQ